MKSYKSLLACAVYQEKLDAMRKQEYERNALVDYRRSLIGSKKIYNFIEDELIAALKWKRGQS